MVAALPGGIPHSHLHKVYSMVPRTLESHGWPFEHHSVLMTPFLGTWHLLMVPTEKRAVNYMQLSPQLQASYCLREQLDR